jgi:deoxyribonuclease-1
VTHFSIRTLWVFLALTIWAGQGAFANPQAVSAESDSGESARSVGNLKIVNFRGAKVILHKVHSLNSKTLYCGCHYSGVQVNHASCGYKPWNPSSRSYVIEWEHVVAAENFGRAFKEWRDGAPQCVRNGRPFKGRKCAETNPEFARMESDLFNLWPEIGEVNALRQNYPMVEQATPGTQFGKCQAQIVNRTFEPGEPSKGIVARIHLYMEDAYPTYAKLSDAQRKLFRAWDRRHPVSAFECELAEVIPKIQGGRNLVLDSRCSKRRSQ